jgi:hypothetical protein
MGPDETPGLTQAAQHLRTGHREAAIASLKESRRLCPRSRAPAYRRSPKLTKLLVYSVTH